jgi:glycerophosphoryl diester phosphodiesterase
LPATDQIFHPAPAVFVELLMKLIQDHQMEAYTTIQSFDFRTLQYLHEHYPTIATAMLIEADDGGAFKNKSMHWVLILLFTVLHMPW